MTKPAPPKHSFAFGDRIVHAGKPEWGAGIVSKARNVTHNGVQAQSLTIRFDRAGLKTLNSAFAQLVPANDHRPAAPQPDVVPSDDDHDAPTTPAHHRPTPSTGIAGSVAAATMLSQDHDAPAADAARADRSWLDEAAATPIDKAMARLPEPCRDPFLPLARRLEHTLKQYRFQPRGASLLDWAAAQTGLADPLSRFSRQELEQFFRRYADARDNHLAELAAELRRTDPPALDEVLRNAPHDARHVVRRIHAGR